ncbi:hypothetical protein [Streptomyces sp. S1D4-20]|uniref:hypothetical protein n=1 Tax=Streptomyces sp. S1D4-20 TaxID=2594462 RepID=UPI001162938A|nr:hypothetical protein [Streptomyces sp. S1D4-20]QDN54277.1 hypothetical protein FNV67_01570 [Streptomyces sp. S1D4-20]
MLPTPAEIAAILSAPEPAKQVLRLLPLGVLDALADAIPPAAQAALSALLAERVRAFLDGTGSQHVSEAAYFTTTEEHGKATWSPFIAALAPSEGLPALGHALTSIHAYTTAETHLAAELSDPDLRSALSRLAELDPPDHEDVLRVHLRTSEVEHLRPWANRS